MGVMSDMLMMVMKRPGSPEKKKRKNRSKKKISHVSVFKYADLAGVLMIVLALTQMQLTLYYPISPYANPLSIYIRNITNFLAIGMLGMFLIAWCTFASEKYGDVRKWNFFRFVAIMTIMTAMAKGLCSLSIVYSQFFKGFYVISQYSIDGIAWIAVASFIMVYYRYVLAHRTHTPNLKRYKIFCIVITVVCFIQTCSAIQYVIMKYTPLYAIWIYYLATAVAWLLMAVFMSFYCRSRFVKLSERHSHHHMT